MLADACFPFKNSLVRVTVEDTRHILVPALAVAAAIAVTIAAAARAATPPTLPLLVVQECVGEH
jgi:hypothetical protein